MIIPYAHRFAIAQIPVPYRFRNETLFVYPLRLRDILEMDMWLQGNVVREYAEQADLLPSDDRESFEKSIGGIITNITSVTGTGAEFIWKSISSMVHYAYLLLRGKMEEDQIKELFFPNGFDEESVTALQEMKNSVTLALPVQEKLNVVRKPPRYLPTREEEETRIYYFLGTKYQWTYDQVLDLTEYQIAWYCHIFPEEREHHEYLDALMHKNKIETDRFTEPQSQESSQPAGTIYFSSPDAYEKWKREHQSNKK